MKPIALVLVAGSALLLTGCGAPPQTSTVDGVSVTTNSALTVAGSMLPALFFGAVGWSMIAEARAGTQPGAAKPLPVRSMKVVASGLIAVGVWVSADCALTLVFESVAVTDDGVRARVGSRTEPDRLDLTFADVESIHTREEALTGKRKYIRRFADIVHKSGRHEAVRMDHHMLRRVWPDIAERARAKGVRVTGGPFTDRRKDRAPTNDRPTPTTGG